MAETASVGKKGPGAVAGHNYRISVVSAGRGGVAEKLLKYAAYEVRRRDKESGLPDLNVSFRVGAREGIFFEEGSRRTSLRPIHFKLGEDGRVCFCVLPVKWGETEKRLKAFACNFVATWLLKGFNHVGIAKGEKKTIFWPYGFAKDADALARRKEREKERRGRREKEKRMERTHGWAPLQG